MKERRPGQEDIICWSVPCQVKHTWHHPTHNHINQPTRLIFEGRTHHPTIYQLTLSNEPLQKPNLGYWSAERSFSAEISVFLNRDTCHNVEQHQPASSSSRSSLSTKSLILYFSFDMQIMIVLYDVWDELIILYILTQ